MADNDVFTALGRIEVDEAALKASLAKAEGEVQQSARRQERTWAEFAERALEQQKKAALAASGGPGAYAARYGPGGVGGPAKAGREATEAAKGFEKLGTASAGATRGMTRMSTMAASMAAGPLSQINPMLGMMTRQMGMGASMAVTMGAAVGGVGIAAVAAVAAITALMQETKALTEVQYETQRALDTLDTGRAIGQLKKLEEEQARVRHEQKMMTQGNWLQRYLASFSQGIREIKGLLGLDTTAQQLKTASDAAAELVGNVEIPREKLNANKELATLAEQNARALMQTAESAHEVMRRYDDIADAAKRRAKAELDLLNLEETQALAKATSAEKDLIKLQFQNKRIQAAERERQAEEKLAQERARSQAQEIQQVAELERFRFDAQMRRVKASRETVNAIMKNENELAQMRAQAMGEGVDISALISESWRQRHELMDQFDEERQAIEKNHAARKESLEEIIALGVDVRKNQQELEKMEIEHAASLDELRAREERAREDYLSRDLQRRKDAYDQLLALEERRVGQIMRLTGTGLGSELNFARTLVDQTAQGSERWFTAVEKVHQTYVKIRDAGRSIFQTMASQAAEELKAEGRKKVTRKELDERIKLIRERQDKARRDFEGGREVDPNEVLKAVSQQDQWKQFDREFGGNLRRAYDAATSQPEAQLAGMVQGWSNAFGDVETVIDQFIGRVQDKMRALGGDLGRVVGSNLSQTFARSLYLEGRRGPIVQESAS